MNRPSVGAVGVVDLEDAGVGVVGRQVGALGEGDAVEVGRGAEDAVLEDALRLEPRAQRAAVEVVLGGAHLLGVERPVVRLERERLGLGVDDRLQRRLLAHARCAPRAPRAGAAGRARPRGSRPSRRR